MNLQLGNTWGLRRMADEAGHFTMVALDQRPPIVNLIAAKRGIASDEVSFTDMIAVKQLLVHVLGQGASAMLMDPNYAFPAALDKLPARTGLVVTLAGEGGAHQAQRSGVEVGEHVEHDTRRRWYG